MDVILSKVTSYKLQVCVFVINTWTLYLDKSSYLNTQSKIYGQVKRTFCCCSKFHFLVTGHYQHSCPQTSVHIYNIYSITTTLSKKHYSPTQLKQIHAHGINNSSNGLINIPNDELWCFNVVTRKSSPIFFKSHFFLSGNLFRTRIRRAYLLCLKKTWGSKLKCLLL